MSLTITSGLREIYKFAASLGIAVEQTWEKVGRIWDFVNECIVKEFASCLRHTYYQAVFYVNPHIYNLNPVKVADVEKSANKVARVFILSHGAGASPGSYVPLAKKLQENGIENVFTVSRIRKKGDNEAVSAKALEGRIEEISQKFLNTGYVKVEIVLVGHSLGAIESAKYVWIIHQHNDQIEVTMVISVAGRLNYVWNRFHWFCADIKEEIIAISNEMVMYKERAILHTIWGENDAIVPSLSAHHPNSVSQHTVKNWGHGGILFAEQTQTQIVNWIKKV